jgi:hypothetical protein
MAPRPAGRRILRARSICRGLALLVELGVGTLDRLEDVAQDRTDIADRCVEVRLEATSAG